MDLYSTLEYLNIPTIQTTCLPDAYGWRSPGCAKSTALRSVSRQAVRLLVDSGTWGLLVYRNHLQIRQQQVPFDTNVSISSPGGMTHVRWLRAGVLLGKDNLGARNVAIADIDSGPQNDFDGLLGLATMGFRRVSFDFENGLFGWE